MGRAKIILTLIVFSFFLFGYNDIYWNMFRSDVSRTAMVTGSAEIDIPSVKWKYYAGGSLSSRQLLVDDINNDGILEYVLISGGKVLAKLQNDILIWDTPYLAAQSLIDIRDIDNDAKKDIISVNSQGRIIILAAFDGSIRWINPETDFNWIGAILIKDINGDGFDDIYAADRACGSATREPKALYGTGIAYSFRKGFNNVEKIFTLEHQTRDYYCGNNNLIADVDGDQIFEIIAPGDQYLYVYSAEDGRLKYVSPVLGAFPWGSPNILTKDVDNDGAEEIFLYSSSNYARGSKRITALKIMDGFLTPIWQISPPEASFQRDSLALAPEPLMDFDSNGEYEFITSLYDSNTGRWKSYILDASFICTNITKWDRFTNCFKSRVEVNDFRFYGSTDIYGNGKRQLLFYDFTANRYGLYELEKNNDEYVLTVKSIFPQGISSAIYYDIFSGASLNYADRLFTFDFGDDGKTDIIMRFGNNIEAYDVSGSYASREGFIEGLVNTSYNFYRPVVYGSKRYLVVHFNNGTVFVYDSQFRPVNDVDYDGIPDLKGGGYIADMLISDLEKDGRPEIFTTRSSGVISVLDGTTTDLVNPPRIFWSRNSGLPTIGDMNNDGKFDMIFGEFEGNNLVINVFNQNLQKIYSANIAPRTETDGFYRDIIFGNANGDNLPDLYYVYTDPYNNLAKYGIVVWDGVSQTAQKLWASEYGLPYQGDGQGYRTVADCNGDNFEDYVINPYRQLRVLNATNGSLLFQNNNANVYAGIISYFGGLLINHGGHTGANYSSPSAYNFTLQKVWESPVKTEYNGKYGSMTMVKSGDSVFMQTAVDSSHVYLYKISDGTFLGERVLGCGKIYEKEEDALKDNCTLGELTSSVAVRDIDKTGRAAFIVGSKDGFIYAIDAENLSLLFMMNFRYPIGNIIAGDLDGDKNVEILISCGDGYIYAIDRAELKPTSYVYENDGYFTASFNNGSDRCPSDKDEDIDCQEYTSTLGANWEKVDGATGYEYAIISQNGTYITYWTDNGSRNSAVTKDLRLVFDFMYYFLVRPYKIEKGIKITGPETISDGVKIIDITPPEVKIVLSNNPVTPDGDGLYDYTDILLTFYDKTYITQYQMQILDKSGNVLFDTNPNFISVQSLSKNIRYDAMFGGKRLPGGEYTVRAIATDIGEHLSKDEKILIICNEYEVVVEEGGEKRCGCPDRDKDGFKDYRCGGSD
ncbi:MAG: VCBS repeat-containing protein, partial [Deltaproteobacteria bacterium]|nr:VCBS repeat-containing protein [Deltaproteobacteria bacterium]